MVTAPMSTPPVTMNSHCTCKPEEVHAVVDAADHQAAQDAVDGLALASEQRGAPDDRGGDGIEDELAAVDVVGQRRRGTRSRAVRRCRP